MASDFDDGKRGEAVDEVRCSGTGREDEVVGDLVLPGAAIERNSLADELENRDDLPCDLGKGELAEIDAKNFRVMRGRDNEAPKRKRVDSIKRAIRAGRKIQRVIVYQDAVTGEKFSPNGAHRQQAYDELELPIPVLRYIVSNAKERAEMESCYANESNGSDRSDADKRYQAAKATELLEKRLGRLPKPNELAKATHTSQKFARAFLQSWFTYDDITDDEEQETDVPPELRKVLAVLEKIKLPDDWAPGDMSLPVLKEIDKALHRIKKHKRPEPEITPAAITTFMSEHNLNNKQMAGLAHVTHTTIARWLKGAVAMSESNKRVLRQILSYSSAQINALLDDEATDDGGDNDDE